MPGGGEDGVEALGGEGWQVDGLVGVVEQGREHVEDGDDVVQDLARRGARRVGREGEGLGRAGGGALRGGLGCGHGKASLGPCVDAAACAVSARSGAAGR